MRFGGVRRVALLLLLIGFAACGEEDPAPQARASATSTSTPTPTPAERRPVSTRERGCAPAGGDLRFCLGRRAYGRLRTGSGPLPVERPRGVGVGGWVWAAASPDGRTVLMQWSGECEIPIAFLVPAEGGRPRRAIAGASNSQALGWTTDGRAIVFVPAQPGCGSGEDAGLFLVAADGTRTRVGPAAARPPFPARVRPRRANTL